MTELADNPVGDELPEFPMARKCPFSPPPEYAKMRNDTPVTQVRLKWSGRPVWVLSRHADVKQLLSDDSTSSNWKDRAYPMQVPIPDEALQHLELPLVAMDPPEHGQRRRLLIPELTVRKAQALRPRIQQITDEHIDAMLAADGPVDLVSALAFPVPSLLFCELLGVPASDSDFFRRCAEALVRTDLTQEEMATAHQELGVYLDKLVSDKENDDSPNLLRRVIERNNNDDQLDRGDIANLVRNLLFGGFDTTSNMIALGVPLLLEHQEQLAELKQDPSLWPKAVEEMLRYLSIADSSPGRALTQDVEIGGQLLRAGESVIALTAAASRDETVFSEPEKFDIHRDARRHSAFGHGAHQCPGANLVRLELEVVFSTLFSRIPELRLAVGFEELTFKSETLVNGVTGELPVTW